MLTDYVKLAKPRIIMGNVITAIAGFTLASKGHYNIVLLCAVLLGLSLIVASACVFNNYIDRDIDKMMVRTRTRALVIGAISPKNALIFGAVLGIGTNALTLLMALAGFAIYVFLYTFLKYTTVYGTEIGSIAGAVPPVV